MARTKTKESRNSDDPLVRVRGGRKGFRMIALSDFKAEIKERKQGKLKNDEKLNKFVRKQKRKQK